VDPAAVAEITGHSVEVWGRFYVRSFGKTQRDEARSRMVARGFGKAAAAPYQPGSAGMLLAFHVRATAARIA
jgi:hypothetical protein